MISILVADDSSEKMDLIISCIQKSNWNGPILRAKTSEEAITIIESEKAINAACIDYYIPRTNGPSIIRALKKKFPLAHVALVSSADNIRNSDEALSAGAEKTICTSKLRAVVEDELCEMLRGWMGETK